MRRIGGVAFLWLLSMFAANAQLLVGNWGGLYLGGHFGAAWGDSDWLDLGAGNIGSHSASGIIGGAQLGYNFELGPWVLGPQASLSGSSLSGKHLDAIFQFGPAPQHDQGRVDLLGTGPAWLVDAPVVLQASRWDALGNGGGGTSLSRCHCRDFRSCVASDYAIDSSREKHRGAATG